MTKPRTEQQKARDAQLNRENYAKLSEAEKEKKRELTRPNSERYNKKVSKLLRTSNLLNKDDDVSTIRKLFDNYPDTKPVVFASINDYKQNQKGKTVFTTWARKEVDILHKLDVEGIEKVCYGHLSSVNGDWNKNNGSTVKAQRIAYGYRV